MYNSIKFSQEHSETVKVGEKEGAKMQETIHFSAVQDRRVAEVEREGMSLNV